jgi:hypothetical protein
MSALAPILAILAFGCGGIGLTATGRDELGGPEDLTVTPTGTIDFGTHSIDEERPGKIDVILIAHGDLPLAIIDVYLEDDAGAVFKLPDVLPLPIRLKAGAEFPVLLRFKPIAAVEYFGELAIILDDGTEEGAAISRVIQGTGCLGTGDC